MGEKRRGMRKKMDRRKKRGGWEEERKERWKSQKDGRREGWRN